MGCLMERSSAVQYTIVLDPVQSYEPSKIDDRHSALNGKRTANSGLIGR